MVVNMQEYQAVGLVRVHTQGRSTEKCTRHGALLLPGYSNVFQFRHPRDLSHGSLAAEDAAAAHLAQDLDHAAALVGQF